MIQNDPESEKEANYFAMHLLVPDMLLLKEDWSDFDWTDDKSIKSIARRYGVPIGIMAIRLVDFFKRYSPQ